MYSLILEKRLVDVQIESFIDKKKALEAFKSQALKLNESCLSFEGIDFSSFEGITDSRYQDLKKTADDKTLTLHIANKGEQGYVVYKLEDDEGMIFNLSLYHVL